jgi:FkbM family methyltransferase
MDSYIGPALTAIRSLNPDHSWLFVEIGAYTGDLSFYMHDQYNCNCVAIEPDYDRYNQMNSLVFGLPIVTVYGAVGKMDGQTEYRCICNVHDEYGGNIVGWENGRVVDGYIVPCFCWDTFISICCNGRVPDLVFMDCEGSERDVLPQILESEFKPKRLIVEWHPAFYKASGRDRLVGLMTQQYEHRALIYETDDGIKHPLYGEFLLR